MFVNIQFLISNSLPNILCRLKTHKKNESGAYEYFVLRAQKIAVSHGYDVVNW